MKYRNSTTSKDIIGFDLFINWDEPIILCEGVFDRYLKTILFLVKRNE